MKKVFVALLLVFACLFLLYQRGEQVIQNSVSSADTLFIFSQTGCSHCQHALEFIDGTVRKKYPHLKVEILNVADGDNMTKLYVVAKQHKLNLKELGTPVLLINGKAMMGWSPDHEKKLLSIIRAIPTKKP